jgi:hypothetical protein
MSPRGKTWVRPRAGGRTSAYATSGIVASLVTLAACSAPSKGSLVLAISTDMQTPKDISVVSIFVTEGSAVKLDYLGHVLPDGDVALPATLAIVEPDDPSTQIQIRIIGFHERTARVLRDIQTTVPHQRDGLMRIPLDFIDDGSGIGTIPSNYFPTATDGVAEGLSGFMPSVIASKCDPMGLCSMGDPSCQTTVDGACSTAFVDPGTLSTYEAQEVFGDGPVLVHGAPSSCFDVASCFAKAQVVSTVTTVQCSFPFPGGADLATFNVGLVTPTTGACVGPGECYVPLPEDPSEGWTIQSGGVVLAPSVGNRVGTGVTVVMSTGSCPTLILSEPVCEPTGEDAATSAPPLDASGVDASEAEPDEAGSNAPP